MLHIYYLRAMMLKSRSVVLWDALISLGASVAHGE